MASRRRLFRGVRLELGGVAGPEFLSSGWSVKGLALAFLSAVANSKLTEKQGLTVLIESCSVRERPLARLAVRHNGIYGSKAMVLFAGCQPYPFQHGFQRIPTQICFHAA